MLLGRKELPTVFRKVSSLKSFKGIRDKRNLLVPLLLSPKARMNSEIMLDGFTNVNWQFVWQNIDNVTSHPPEVADKFSSVKVIFLPINMTSHLQSLNAGILKNFKVQYRKLLLKHILAQIDSTSLTPSKTTKIIDVLLAIVWVKQAWEEVKV